MKNIEIIECQNSREVDDIIEIAVEASEEDAIRAISAEELTKMLRKSDYYYVVVAKVSEKTVGFATAAYSWGKLHIYDIAVKRDMRRQGIGKALVSHLIGHAKKLKLTEVYCEVKVKNKASINLFRKLGFRSRGLYLIAGGFYALYMPIDVEKLAY
jgi:ribosomal-protein-alanine N-acetyltransferase